MQELSEQNSRNRKKQKSRHCGGSKSFVRYRHEMRDKETNVPPDRIQVWHQTHYKPDKGWANSFVEEKYNEMLAFQSEPTPEGSKPLTVDEICNRVLGTRAGYICGMGHGMRPESSSSVHTQCDTRLLEERRRAEDAARRAEELDTRLSIQQQDLQTTQQELQMTKQDLQATKQQLEGFTAWQQHMDSVMQRLLSHDRGSALA
uniref:Transposase, Ptta/En/Spm, plant n=2 Tax=Davidia involucrata TaxID=16924 RepID=A0A5B6ZAY8_DAVIN